MSVVARRVRAVAARLALDSRQWSFPYGVHLQASPGAVLLVVSGIWSCGLWNRWKVSLPCWLPLCCWGACCHCCVFGLLCLCAVVRCARDVELSRCFVCRVALLVERCDTRLWLLSAWRWLVVNSSEVLLEFFSVASGGNEDRFALVSAVAVLPQSLRCAVGLAGAFWRVFPRAVPWWFWWRFSQDQLVLLLQFAYCSVLYDGSCCLVVWVVHSSEGSSQDRPLSLLVEVLPRSALCLFWATVVLPLWFEVCRLVGLRSGEVLLGWLLALLVEMSCRCLPVGLSVLQSAWALSVKVLCAWPCVWTLRWLAGLPCLWTLCIPGVRAVGFVFGAWRALADGGLVSAVGARLAVLLVEALVLRYGLPLACGRDSLRCVSPSSVFHWLLEVVMLHCGFVSSRGASLRPSGGVIFP
ncbi:hypothetical protein Taro_008904 [Colocasia esculenta]|uniref:Uncharacterized protein n=1 Tax=Colocasia esculenta TaxID=4460 RepID=A0A843U4U0_COLES|nr:hypothetical protein [Colocasia esculenta]